MSKMWSVTLSGKDPPECVHASWLRVNESGTLIFLKDTGNGSEVVSRVFAPGVWLECALEVDAPPA